MLWKYGLGTHITQGMRVRMPRAIVGAVLGLVLTIVQGHKPVRCIKSLCSRCPLLAAFNMNRSFRSLTRSC